MTSCDTAAIAASNISIMTSSRTVERSMQITQSRAMDCLANDELLRSILQHLQDDGASRTIANLARSCQTTSVASLDVLWHTMSSLVPLFQLLPSELWRIVSSDMGDAQVSSRLSVFRFIGSPHIKERDFADMSQYAGRVRKLRYRMPCAFGIDASDDVISHVLTKWPSQSGLLPELRELVWHHADSDSRCFPLVTGLPGPRLRVLDLAIPNSKAMMDVLTYMLPRFHALEELRITVCNWAFDQVVRFSVAPLLAPLTQLRVLALAEQELAPEDVAVIAALPSLRRASFHVSHEGRSTPPFVLENGFPALEHLELTSSKVTRHLIDFVKTIAPPRLAGLVFQVEWCPVADDLRAYFDFLAQRPWTLREIAFRLTKYHMDDPSHEAAAAPRYTITPAELAPLLSLEDLESLDIHTHHLAVDAQFLATVPVAFPRIKRLSLMHGTNAADCAHVPLPSLLPLAQCPALEEISMDLSSDDDAAGTPPGPSSFESHSRVHSLRIALGSIGDPSHSLQYLLHLFPALESLSVDDRYLVKAGDPALNKRKLAWLQVQRALKARRLMA